MTNNDIQLVLSWIKQKSNIQLAFIAAVMLITYSPFLSEFDTENGFGSLLCYGLAASATLVFSISANPFIFRKRADYLEQILCLVGTALAAHLVYRSYGTILGDMTYWAGFGMWVALLYFSYISDEWKGVFLILGFAGILAITGCWDQIHHIMGATVLVGAPILGPEVWRRTTTSSQKERVTVKT